MHDPSFWQDQGTAREVTKELAALKDERDAVLGVERKIEDLEVYMELLSEDAEGLASEVEKEVADVEATLTRLHVASLLDEPYDHHNAILTIHPGAGGTESQDWAQMLLRMYSRWGELKGFKIEVTDLLPGDEAGIKSATVLVEGEKAYGYLKGEMGVHRLVRISPFDYNKRRHTSFASVEVLPQFEEEVDITMKEEDLKIDTYRASGAGGQHVNKTDSAVRITHLPSGIVVQCQNERSQHSNRATAMKILMAKLFQRELEARQRKVEALAGVKKEISWGNQIRSYVFHPYNLVKDLRTGVETSNVQDVMDGDLDRFIEQYLMAQKMERSRNHAKK